MQKRLTQLIRTLLMCGVLVPSGAGACYPRCAQPPNDGYDIIVGVTELGGFGFFDLRSTCVQGVWPYVPRESRAR